MPKITATGVGIKKLLPAVGGEATLDLEILAAAAPGLKGIDVYESTARWRPRCCRRSPRR